MAVFPGEHSTIPVPELEKILNIKERIKASKRKYYHSEKGKLAYKKYSKSKKRKEYQKKYKQTEKYKKYDRDYNLKKNFGISLDEYNKILIKQNGVCDICGRKDSRELAVDHDHKTGKIRGLLCQGCNTSLGKMDDNVIFLQRAIDYLLK